MQAEEWLIFYEDSETDVTENPVSDSQSSESVNQSNQILELSDGDRNILSNSVNIQCFEIVGIGMIVGVLIARGFIDGLWNYMN